MLKRSRLLIQRNFLIDLMERLDLEQVEQGQEFTFTRHGNPAARMLPIRTTSTVESRRTAIAAMKELAVGNRLSGLTVKELLAEGRK